MKLIDIIFKILIIIAITIFLSLYHNSLDENRYTGFFTPGHGDGVTIVDTHTGEAFVFYGFRDKHPDQWLRISPYGKTEFIKRSE